MRLPAGRAGRLRVRPAADRQQREDGGRRAGDRRRRAVPAPDRPLPGQGLPARRARPDGRPPGCLQGQPVGRVRGRPRLPRRVADVRRTTRQRGRQRRRAGAGDELRQGPLRAALRGDRHDPRRRRGHRSRRPRPAGQVVGAPLLAGDRLVSLATHDVLRGLRHDDLDRRRTTRWDGARRRRVPPHPGRHDRVGLGRRALPDRDALHRHHGSRHVRGHRRGAVADPVAQPTHRSRRQRADDPHHRGDDPLRVQRAARHRDERVPRPDRRRRAGRARRPPSTRS